MSLAVDVGWLSDKPGAPESVLARCSADESALNHETYQTFGESGFRVLGVAYRPIGVQAKYDREDERDLILAHQLRCRGGVDDVDVLGLR